MRFSFIEAQKAKYPVTVLCSVLQVSSSGFYAWRERRPSRRSQVNRDLTRRIFEIYHGSRQTYGSPRVHEELRQQGYGVSRKRVARLMRQRGLRARIQRRFHCTTDSGHQMPVAVNVLGRRFRTTAPDTVWATDITYVRTWEGWLYVAVVIDLFSRRVVGWAMADHLRTELALDALNMALGRRLPPAKLIHHSDRGSQYASARYQRILKDNAIVCSMSRAGNCWDNAVVESFFATLKTELIHRRSWPTRRQAKAAIAEYIELFYNCRRIHSSLAYRSPAQYEKEYLSAATAA
jgi:transposase InsO family protein